MKYLSRTSLMALAICIGSYSTNAVTAPPPADEKAQNIATSLSPAEPHETILLVSLDDGSVIMQTINSSADLCFKSNSGSTTTCLTQGAPILDPSTNTVIGYEMIEDRIELVAK